MSTSAMYLKFQEKLKNGNNFQEIRLNSLGSLLLIGFSRDIEGIFIILTV